jgi:serine protease Do
LKRLFPAFLVVLSIGLGFTTSVLADHWQVVRAEQLRAQAETKIYKVQFIMPRGVSGGTGFLLKKKDNSKVVVTNKHVCDLIERGVGPFLRNQKLDKYYPTKILKASNSTDLCLVEPVGELASDNDGFTLSEGAPLKDDAVFVYGHPWLGPLTSATGRFDGMSTTYDDRGAEVTSGLLTFPIYPGSSGSPVLNVAGEVVGVVFAYDSKGMGLFVEHAKLVEFLNE